MAATKQELKEMIVDLRVENMRINIPLEHCPYAYYDSEDSMECGEISCDECRENFFDIMRKRIEKEVASL